jgi:hypothetical protein
MDTMYRRRQPGSRLERILARLLLGHRAHREVRVDVVHRPHTTVRRPDA